MKTKLHVENETKTGSSGGDKSTTIWITGSYKVIYADPPWYYHGQHNYKPHGHAAVHYPCMKDGELMALPVKSIAAPDAVLFIWTTSPMLERTFPIIKAWGFKYKSSFVWDKQKHNMGYYCSVRHELLLIATKGKCTPEVKRLFDSVQSIERTKHSQKPEDFRNIIDTLYPSGNRIELFARKQAAGWNSWGNEVPTKTNRLKVILNESVLK